MFDFTVGKVCGKFMSILMDFNFTEWAIKSRKDSCKLPDHKKLSELFKNFNLENYKRFLLVLLDSIHKFYSFHFYVA